jgi:hypothetical protein
MGRAEPRCRELGARERRAGAHSRDFSRRAARLRSLVRGYGLHVQRRDRGRTAGRYRDPVRRVQFHGGVHGDDLRRTPPRDRLTPPRPRPMTSSRPRRRAKAMSMICTGSITPTAQLAAGTQERASWFGGCACSLGARSGPRRPPRSGPERNGRGGRRPTPPPRRVSGLAGTPWYCPREGETARAGRTGDEPPLSDLTDPRSIGSGRSRGRRHKTAMLLCYCAGRQGSRLLLNHQSTVPHVDGCSIQQACVTDE